MMEMAALAIFVAVAIFGGVMTTKIARGEPYPGNWGMMHGATGLVGLGVLAAALWNGGSMLGWGALIVLAAAMVGGTVLFGVLMRGKERNIFVAIAHGSLGGAGVIVLLFAFYGTF